MKRLMLLFAAAAAVLPFAYTTASGKSTATRSICHRTSSTKVPYTKIQVTAAQLRAHGKHAADIIPAPRGACPRTVLTATSGGTALNVAMTGEAEAPAGDPVATGEAVVRLRRNQGQVCFTLEVRNLGEPALAAHIHTGAATESGGIVVTLRTPNAEGQSRGCVSASRAIVNRILASPASYYVNVHTRTFPAGVVRGQLSGTSDDAFGWIQSVQMNGANECNTAGTCNLGDPDGAGTAVIRLRPGLVCYRIAVQNIQLPAVGAHIHRGGPRSSGPIVVSLTAPDASGASAGCATASQALIDEIAASPAAFYVNVHARDFPGGAVRAQLG